MTRHSLFNRLLLLLCSGSAAACVAGQSTASPKPTLSVQLSQGEQLFSQYCASCHAVEAGTVIVGPSLFEIADRAAERAPDLTSKEYVEQSILQPEAYLALGYDDLIPSNFSRRLDGHELDAIVAYVLSLH